MPKKTIVFTSVYAYITNPLYYSFVENLKDFRKVYLHVKDPVSVEFDNQKIDNKEILEYFDEYIELDYNLKDELAKVYANRKGIFKKLSFNILQPYYEYKEELCKYLKKYKPRAVITCSDMTVSDRIISHWCKKHKIAHIIIQNSFIDDIYYKKYGFKHKIKYFFFNRLLKAPIFRRQHLFGNESQTSYLLLWSEYFVLDPKRKNTHFIGNAVFDKLFKKFSPERKKSNNITICTQPIDNMFSIEKFKEIIEYFKLAIKNNPDLHFFIKIHPRERIDKYTAIFTKQDYPNAKVVKDDNLYELFEKSIAQISVSSFTSFEAAALGVPIIILNPNDEFEFFDHYREEIDIRVRQLEEMLSAIETICSNENWSVFLKKREIYFKKMLHYIDGKSSERTAEKIKKLIK